MKHEMQIELFLHSRLRYDGEPEFRVHLCDMSGSTGFGVLVTQKAIDVEFDVPMNFNPSVEMVNLLRKEQKAIQAEAQMQVTRLEERIQSLLCIEHKAAA